MALGLTAMRDAIQSHALASGHFETVNGHEPKSKPPNGLTAAVWVQEIGPLPSESGLAATTTRVEFMLRIYLNMLRDPQDEIDIEVGGAVDALMEDYTGDFTLGGLIRQIDILGAYGKPLSAQAGYLNLSGTLYRVMDLIIPCVVNDAFTQAQ